MWTKDFWKAVLERMIKSAAQGALTGTGLGSVGLFELDWLTVLSIAASAAVLSVLTSIASGAFNNGQISIGRSEIVPDTDLAPVVVAEERMQAIYDAEQRADAEAARRAENGQNG